MTKCKGCANGEVDHVPIEDLRATPAYFNAGPALKHTDPPCRWFLETSNSEILAYINVAEFKTQRPTPLPGLATK